MTAPKISGPPLHLPILPDRRRRMNKRKMYSSSSFGFVCWWDLVYGVNCCWDWILSEREKREDGDMKWPPPFIPWPGLVYFYILCSLSFFTHRIGLGLGEEKVSE